MRAGWPWSPYVGEQTVGRATSDAVREVWTQHALDRVAWKGVEADFLQGGIARERRKTSQDTSKRSSRTAQVWTLLLLFQTKHALGARREVRRRSGSVRGRVSWGISAGGRRRGAAEAQRQELGSSRISLRSGILGTCLLYAPDEQKRRSFAAEADVTFLGVSAITRGLPAIDPRTSRAWKAFQAVRSTLVCRALPMSMRWERLGDMWARLLATYRSWGLVVGH